MILPGITVSDVRVAESPHPQGIHTQQNSQAKDHCPSHHTDQKNLSLVHGPSQSKKLWQLSQPELSLTAPPPLTMA